MATLPTEPDLYGGRGEPKDYGGRGEPKDYGGRGEPKDYGSRGRPKDYGGRGEPKDYGSSGGPTTPSKNVGDSDDVAGARHRRQQQRRELMIPLLSVRDEQKLPTPSDDIEIHLHMLRNRKRGELGLQTIARSDESPTDLDGDIRAKISENERSQSTSAQAAPPATGDPGTSPRLVPLFSLPGAGTVNTPRRTVLTTLTTPRSTSAFNELDNAIAAISDEVFPTTDVNPADDFSLRVQELTKTASVLVALESDVGTKTTATLERLRLLKDKLRASNVNLQKILTALSTRASRTQDMQLLEQLKQHQLKLKAEILKNSLTSERVNDAINDIAANATQLALAGARAATTGQLKKHRREDDEGQGASGTYGHSMYPLPGKATDQPTGQSITPPTLYNRMRTTSLAYGRVPQNVYFPGELGYIPHFMSPNGFSVFVPNGWDSQRLQACIAAGTVYRGNSPHTVPIDQQRPFGKFDVESYRERIHQHRINITSAIDITNERLSTIRASQALRNQQLDSILQALF